ncbi:hypothetical protein LWC34_10350 [Kibdelosporangium philippinense]|uniref:DUF1877 domain-containing protein n=1 Tax=Kibdelosporangium philippinense TaxID=211113 RepID=A0ABS8Z9M3_9PSEU|nr:hypothetical protein [Kibdelosporangium philippinense]MCE7003228.1 hypothetical protein [Kibdelosporangium philippinense]
MADFYADAFRPALTAELRHAFEPVLPLLALCNEIPVPFDRQCLHTDAGLAPPPEYSSYPLYALRPSTVHDVLDGAKSLPWQELDDFVDGAGDIAGQYLAPFKGYNYLMLRSFALRQLERLQHAAQRGHGVVLILSV